MNRFPYFDITGPFDESFRVEVKTERITIGRLEEWNDIALSPDPQQLVSRKAHCTIEYDNGWWLVDNGSVNRTFLLHDHNAPMEVVQGRIPLHHGEIVCILGLLLDNGIQQYWELRFYDPAITKPAPLDSPTNTGYLEYNWPQARLYRIEHGHRQEIGPLRPQEHKLIRYMAQRNRANDGEPVLCTFEELINAIWDGDNVAPDADLAHLIWQLRKKIERDYRKPQFLETAKGLGYRIRLRPLE